MLNSRTTTNVILLVIAGIVLVSVAQGGLGQISSLFGSAPVGQAPASPNTPPSGGSQVSSVPAPSVLERVLVYTFLIWALALGVEAGVEVIRWIRHPRLSKEPGPTDILSALNPWLPSPVDTSIQPKPEVKPALVGPSPKDTGAGPASELDSGHEPIQVGPAPKDSVVSPVSKPDSGYEPAPVGAQEKALLGIAVDMYRSMKIDRMEDLTRIFYVFALKQREHLKNEDRRLRQNRAISLFVAIPFAFITGVNTFAILLDPNNPNIPSDSIGYKVGGILLSAFAATAGSAVWHDLLDKLRQSKEPATPPGQPGSP